MAFDPSTAKPVTSGFDPSTAKPVEQPITQGLFGSHVGENSPILQKARLPQQAAAATSKAMMDAYDPQTKSVVANAILRIPETAASIGTKLVSNAMSPENVIVAGALKALPYAAPAANAVGRWVGEGAEKLSGLSYDTPGVLARTVENPSLPFKPGVEAANETYSKLVDPKQVRETIKMAMDKKDLVQTAYDAVKDGTITPDEAFIARKTIGQVKKLIPQDTFFTLRKAFDDIAKTKFAGADTARAVAEDADALRNLAPLNKNGTTSIFKTGIGMAGAGASHFTPAAALTVPAFSPAVQAGLAAGIGVAKAPLSALLANPEVASMGLASFINRNK